MPHAKPAADGDRHGHFLFVRGVREVAPAAWTALWVRPGKKHFRWIATFFVRRNRLPDKSISFSGNNMIRTRRGAAALLLKCDECWRFAGAFNFWPCALSSLVIASRTCERNIRMDSVHIIITEYRHCSCNFEIAFYLSFEAAFHQ